MYKVGDVVRVKYYDGKHRSGTIMQIDTDSVPYLIHCYEGLKKGARKGKHENWFMLDSILCLDSVYNSPLMKALRDTK